jgi:hypothetical protein
MEHAIDKWLVKRVIELTGDKNALRGLPSPAQLSRAQLAARQAWLKQDLGLIVKHFEKLSRLSQREWQYARLGNQDMKQWILDRAKNPEIEKPVMEPFQVAGETAEYAMIQVKTVARLIERVLKQAVKREKQKREGGAE